MLKLDKMENKTEIQDLLYKKFGTFEG